MKLLCSLVCAALVLQVSAVLNVHLVCHTHDDVGWLKTVDQYYMGANNSIQHAGVQYVLDSVILALEQNPDRKFIYVEQGYFQRWWNEQTPFMHRRVEAVVKKGQLEFINGGWCMHDEAATHYVAMVDQTALGHHFIKNQFQKVPTVGWQIDPFGHSLTQAALLSAEVGFNSLFFARIDYQDLDNRRATNNTEFVWRASASLGSSAQVFTGAFSSGSYGPPDGFCFDLFCADPPIQDDPALEDYNVQNRVNAFVQQAMDQASMTRGNDIMMTMGSDFQYENANEWYKNLDKLIKYANADGRVNVLYSTPSIYTLAKYKSNLTWSVKTDDFFPYADCPHCYWTGYMTSRTSLKHYVRLSTAFLQAARQVDIFTGGDNTAVYALYEALSVAQHHDGVSGTSKQHVAYDYAKRLSIGWQVAAQAMTNGFSMWANKTGTAPPFSQCTLLNVSSCAGSTPSTNAFSVLLYNPLGRTRTEYVRLPVALSAYAVYGPTGAEVPCDVSSTPASSTVLPPIPAGQPSPSPYQLAFAVQVPAFGFATYFIQPGSGEKTRVAQPVAVPVRPIRYHKGQPIKTNQPRGDKIPADQSVVIQNAAVAVTFDSTTGYLTALQNKAKNLTIPLSQQWFYYYAYLAQPNAQDQNSGAYIFRPNGTNSYPISSANPTLSVVNGQVIQEVRQTIGSWLTSTVRLYGDEEYVEFEYSIGSIPINDGIGKEIVTRFTSTIETEKTWYTDSNGREFQQRVRNYRPTWPLQVNEPVAGNYVPMNAISYIQDSNSQLTFLNDRSQGCGSIEDGQLEIMVQRRLLGDDSRGVGEPLNETSGITPYPNPVRVGPGMPVVGRHFVILETPDDSLAVARPLASRVFSPLQIAFSTMPAGGTNSVQSWIQKFNVQGSQAVEELPVNVEVMTLQTWPDDGTSVIRLAHQFAVNEDPVLSQPVTVDLNAIFSSFTITSVLELSLSANQPLSNVHLYQWQTQSEDQAGNKLNPEPPTRRLPIRDTQVTLQPMEIRTFQIGLSFK